MNGAFPLWQVALTLVLLGVYFLLALFRAAQVELSRVKLGGVLREAGKSSGLLERWAEPDERKLLALSVQIAFQTTLILTAILMASSVEQMLTGWAQPLRLAAAFIGTALFLVVVVRMLLVRVVIALFPEQAIRISGPVATVTALVVMPAVVLMDGVIGRMSSAARRGVPEVAEESTEEDLHAFVSMGEEEGILEKEEGDLVRNIVDFGDTIVREIMTPRTDMVVLGESANLGEAQGVFLSSKHSRIPVQRGSADHIVGVLSIKDVLPVWCEPAATAIDDVLRPVMFVPETKKVLDLLREMQKDHVPLAIVIDEYGGTAGLVTVEDLVEEIVGDIQDEHEIAEEDIIRERSGALLMSGFSDIWEVADLLGFEVKGNDFDTVGGFVTSLLGRVPEAGEVVDHDDVQVEIVAADGRRVLKVRMRKKRPAPLKETKA